VSELPPGWAEAPIGSLCSLNNGRAFKPTEWTTDGLPIVRIQNLNNPEAPFNHFRGEFESRYHLRGGELLFAWSGTPGTSFGAHVWRGGEAVLNQHIFRVDFEEDTLDKRFFRYAINQKLDELIDIAHGGVGLRHVTKGTFERTLVAIPPLNEQKRIADKLDVLLARVDACRGRLDRVPGILKRFRQAVLAAATSGKLTEDWREMTPALGDVSAECSARDSADQASSMVDLPLPITWRWSKFGEFVSSFRSGTSGVPQDEPTNFPVLRSSSVRPGKVDLSDVRFLLPGARFRQDDLLADGDLLFTRLSGSLDYVANCAMVHDLDGRRVYYPDRLFRAKVIQPSSAPYFELCFSSPNLRRFLVVEAKSSAGHQRVSMGAVTGFPIPLPPPSEQFEIVRRVEALFAYADRLEARYVAARAQVERLTPALLAKAFRGELVPQDPNDEPAAVLLERIRAARATSEGATSPKRRKGDGRPKTSRKAEVLMLTRKDIQDAHLTAILKERGPLTAEALWSASLLDIEDFYDQLKDEEARGLLREKRGDSSNAPRTLEAA
jgi:type I restriction enzyme S subunit